MASPRHRRSRLAPVEFVHAVDAWVLRHLQWMRGATAAIGVLLLVSSLYVILGGKDHVGRLTALPPTPPSVSTEIAATPPESSSARSSSASKTPSKTACTAGDEHGAGGTVPVHICIPEIGVDADMMQLGLNPDRTVEVPPLSEVGLAGWYKYSPAPGVVGPSIILGHIDSAQYGKGVFFDLARLHAGDTFTLTRADGMVARFKVDRLEQIAKSSFPTDRVYGNTSNAQIRLITCGGTFDASAGSYLDNIIAYGTLVSLKRA